MRALCLIVGALLTLPLAAQEKVTLTAPDTNAEYRIAVLQLTSNDPATPADEGHIYIRLDGALPQWRVECVYSSATTPTGTVLITALNKANLSTAYAGNGTTGSLRQRIFHRLVVLGESAQVCTKTIAGALSGAPE